MQLVLQLLTLLGSVTLFLFGLSLLSGGLQKVAGNGLRAFLASMTSTPFKRILTGVTVTAAIQSSTATTVMVVSFVNAGLLTLAQAIGVIMGANIGTTVTSWIMAVFGFSFDMATFAFPLVAIGYILSQNKSKARVRDIGSIIIGFALFFIGFSNLKSTANTILSGFDFAEALSGLTSLTLGPINISVLLFVLVGTVLTICFQSSAATMAIVMLLITTGVIPFEIAAAMILGENIGTTVAANIAASVGNTSSRRAAMAHTVFNVFGVFWVLCIFKPFLRLVGSIVEGVFGLPNPLTADLTSAANPELIRSSLLYSVTTMHTLFNLVNTCLLVWFIPRIEALVSRIIPSKEEDNINRLQYISAGPLSTAELSMDQAKHEIIHFGQISYKGFGYLREAINAPTIQDFAQMREKLDKYEEIADRMEYEIADYLGKVAREEISEHTNTKIRETYKIIGEIESLGDSGEAIGRMIQRIYDFKKSLTPELLTRLNEMLDLLDNAYRVMNANLEIPSSKLMSIDNAREAEAALNSCRDRLRTEHLSNIGGNPNYDYQTGVIYMDIASELEKMGDFIINISEAQIAKRNINPKTL